MQVEHNVTDPRCVPLDPLEVTHGSAEFRSGFLSPSLNPLFFDVHVHMQPSTAGFQTAYGVLPCMFGRRQQAEHHPIGLTVENNSRPIRSGRYRESPRKWEAKLFL